MIALDLFRSQINDIMRRNAAISVDLEMEMSIVNNVRLRRLRLAYWLKRLRAEHRASGEYQVALTEIAPWTQD